MQKGERQDLGLRTVDLFAGCGGLSLGFMRAGFDVVAAYDSWPLAHEVYQANFDHDAHLFDLSNTSAAVAHIQRYAPYAVIGGPPCQDFSIAGKRMEAHRANLTLAFAAIVAEVGPRVFVMENVYNIEKSRILKSAETVLKDAGYGLTSRVIDASLAGVPQMRRRFFLIGARGLPDGAFTWALDRNLAQRPMTVAEYFGDSLELDYYYAHPRSYKRRAVFSVHEPSATIRRVNRPIPQNYQRHPADKADVTASVRPLTTQERSRIQTFPESFVWIGSKSQQEHLLANAVPVRLAEYVGKQVMSVLHGDMSGAGFPESSRRVTTPQRQLELALNEAEVA